MNIKEQENQLSIDLNLRIMTTIIVFLILVVFMGYRLYMVSRTNLAPVVSGVVVPRLKIDNFEELSTSPKATTSSAPNLSIPNSEPFD